MRVGLFVFHEFCVLTTKWWEKGTRRDLIRSQFIKGNLVCGYLILFLASRGICRLLLFVTITIARARSRVFTREKYWRRVFVCPLFPTRGFVREEKVSSKSRPSFHLQSNRMFLRASLIFRSLNYHIFCICSNAFAVVNNLQSHLFVFLVCVLCV